MITKPLFNSIALVALATACSSPESETESSAGSNGTMKVATATMSDAVNNAVGEVSLLVEDNSASLQIALGNIDPGTKAIHLHSIGKCDGPDFTSAGGHLNPAGATHGSLSEGGKHLGDLPNIEVPESGELTHALAIDGSADTILAEIFDEDGTAVMIHAGPDDYKTDPAGAAGPRIACGVLTPIP